MQIHTRLRWCNAMVKSDWSGSKGLTLYTCLCYRCCALEFLYKVVDLPTSDCSIFTENEDLVQIKVIITSHNFGPDFTLHYPKLHGSPPREFTLNILYWKFFHPSGFLSSLRFPWKELALQFFTVLNIFFNIQDFWATLRLPWKTECALNSLYWIYIFLSFRIFEQLALALKNRVAL